MPGTISHAAPEDQKKEAKGQESKRETDAAAESKSEPRSLTGESPKKLIGLLTRSIRENNL